MTERLPWSSIMYDAPIGPTPSGAPLSAKKKKESTVWAPGTQFHGLTQSQGIELLNKLQNLEGLFGLDGYGGGGGYRPQTAEEAANLLAQAQLFKAQAADIPLDRELARRQTLAEIGATQAALAANPRRIFEALFYQSRVKPTEMAKSLQEKVTIPGFKKGKTVEGPVLAQVGKHDDEYALLAPGSVVAPKPKGETATVGNALSAIIAQMREGGIVSKAKARKILEHGEIGGRPLTEKQRGLFGLIAGGGTPTRLEKAQEGLGVLGPPGAWFGKKGTSRRRWVPGSFEDGAFKPWEETRQETTETVLGATKKATAGTSLFDPLGGGQFTEEQKKFMGGLNLRAFAKLSPTQREAFFSMLSAGRVEPEDFIEALERSFAGFNPIRAGTRARFAGILGR